MHYIKHQIKSIGYMESVIVTCYEIDSTVNAAIVFAGYMNS